MGTALPWNDRLSPEQEVAASHTGSHARLLAGPGTGKTFTLAGRVVYLVTEQGVKPSEILVLTFTRMATRELRSRIGVRLAPYTTEMPYIATLHSFALRQLRHNARSVDALPKPLRIADDWEERRLIQEEMKDLLEYNAATVKERFSQLSADWQTLKADGDDWEANLPDPRFLGVWQEHRRIYGYTLRSELVYQLKKAMEQSAQFALEPVFKHVLIDEYQDLNPCDLAIAEAIAGTGATLLACGDDDQSIYGFRYADPSGIRDFTTQFSDSSSLEITECRRCGSNILNAALWVARQDIARVDKNLHAVEGSSPGEVQILSFPTGQSEAEGIARLCQKYLSEGVAASDILILVRSNRNGTFSAPVMQELTRLGIPVAANADKESLLEERPGRNLLSLLRLIANPNDHLAWRSRLELTGGVGPSTNAAIYRFATAQGIGFAEAVVRLGEYLATIPAGARGVLTRQITDTREAIERFSAMITPQAGTDEGDPLIALKDFIQAVAESEVADEEDRAQILSYIGQISDTSGAKSLEDLLVSIAVGKDDREETEVEAEPDSINILSMHQAKGLTAEVVFVMAAEDEVLPRFLDQASINDDRRLLYVSMTRAKQKLYMTYASTRTGNQVHTGRNSGNPSRHLSRFLANGPFRVMPGARYIELNG